MTVYRLKYATNEDLTVRLAFDSHCTAIGEIDSRSEGRVEIIGGRPGRGLSLRNRRHRLFYGLCKRMKRKSAADKDRDARQSASRERTNMVKKHTSKPFLTN